MISGGPPIPQRSAMKFAHQCELVTASQTLPAFASKQHPVVTWFLGVANQKDKGELHPIAAKGKGGNKQ